MREITRERDQLKGLNTKLVERVEQLQNIIEQEASAHQYYYDYPPKADQSLSTDKKADTESAKMRKLFEEQMANMKRKYEREYESMVTSFSEEKDGLEQMLSQALRDLNDTNQKYIDLDRKFQEYYVKSDRYIKDKE